jgi:predicted nucleic acid-binding Zn ribbon protein
MPIYEYHCCSCGKDFPLVPKLQLGNALPGKLQLPSCYS